MKNNIIKFPASRIEQRKRDEEEMAVFCAEESAELVAFLLEEIDTILVEISEQGEHTPFDDFDFRNEDNPESKDMFVIANLINAMFLRYFGLEHSTHIDLDDLFLKINEMHKNNDTT
jgi:hypothetical protein|tara:strand:- start:7265 stop:7615 length:351 start_codon:yes stop_codon:yes gene_type:complete